MCRAYGAREALYITDPTLTRWAKLCRAYGALARLGPDAVLDALRAISRVLPHVEKSRLKAMPLARALSSAGGASQVSPARKGWEN
jgi:hypothetical protein